MGDIVLNAEKKEVGLSSIHVPMLNTSNYTVWAMRMKIALKVNKVWEATEIVEIDEEKNNLAMALIVQAIPEALFLQVGELDTAKKIWDAIKARHVGADRVKEARLQTLMAEFDRLKMKDTEKVDEFGGKLAEISAKSAALGVVIEEPKMVKKFLSSLPRRKFIQIVASLEQVLDLNTTSFEDIMGRIKAYEERISEEEQTHDDQNTLMYSNMESQQTYNNDGEFRNRGRGGRFNSRGRGRGRSNGERDMSKVICYRCDKAGHYASKCPDRLLKLQEAQEHDIDDTQDADELMLHEEVYLNEERCIPSKFEKTAGEEDIWYLDNGASNHMSGDQRYFTKINSSITGKVRFGDDSRIDIKGKGSISLIDMNGKLRVMTDVYFIPDLKSNIISLGQATESGCDVRMKGEWLVMKDIKGNLLVKTKRSKNRLYKVNYKIQAMTKQCFTFKRKYLNLKERGSLNSVGKDKELEALEKKIPFDISKLDKILMEDGIRKRREKETDERAENKPESRDEMGLSRTSEGADITLISVKRDVYGWENTAEEERAKVFELQTTTEETSREDDDMRQKLEVGLRDSLGQDEYEENALVVGLSEVKVQLKLGGVKVNNVRFSVTHFGHIEITKKPCGSTTLGFNGPVFDKEGHVLLRDTHLFNKVYSMKRKLLWLEYDMKKAEYMDGKRKIKEAMDSLGEAARDLNSMKEPIEKQKKEKEEIDLKCKRVKNLLEANGQKRSHLLEKEDEAEARVVVTYKGLEELKKHEEHRQERILKASEDLAVAEQELQRMHVYERPMAQLEELSFQVTELHNNINRNQDQKVDNERLLSQKKLEGKVREKEREKIFEQEKRLEEERIQSFKESVEKEWVELKDSIKELKTQRKKLDNQRHMLIGTFDGSYNEDANGGKSTIGRVFYLGRIKFKEMRDLIGVQDLGEKGFKLKGENDEISLKET